MKKITCVIGRMNPPTKGHNTLFSTAHQLSDKPIVGLIVEGNTDDVWRNPLTSIERLAILRSIYPTVVFFVVENAYNGMQVLDFHGYQPDTIVCGDDRKETYSNMLNRYWGEGAIISITRNTISATVLRECITNDDFNGYLDKLIDMPLSDACSLWEILRKRINHGGYI